MNYNRRLRQLEAEGKPIRIGIVGAGQMGSSLISLLNGLPGMRVVAVADIDEASARAGCVRGGIAKERIRSIESAGASPEEVDVVRISGDLEPLLHDRAVDVVVEATGVPDVGAQVAAGAIGAGKHIVMLNAETDATVGALLARRAEAAGVVYTGASGDEPAAIMELYNFADALGFEVLVAGKGKNNPLHTEATPRELEARAAKEGADARMLCSFVDGTKTMVEMTCVANATGFVPDVPGMHGVTADVDTVLERLCVQSSGGVLQRYGVVEYVDGLAPGVFVIVRTDRPLVDDTMQYLKMGSGPNYLLFRPYHLTSLETPISIARAALDGEPTIIASGKPVAETVAVAKKALSSGEALDGIGGYTAYGRCYTTEQARKDALLPFGLVAPGARMRRPVQAGTPLTYADVELPPSTIRALRDEQDRLSWSGSPSSDVTVGAAATASPDASHRGVNG